MRKTVATSSLSALAIPAAFLSVTLTVGGCAGRQPTAVAGSSRLPENWLTLSEGDARMRTLPEPTRDYLLRVRENMANERNSDAYKFYGRYSDALLKQMSDANQAANTAFLVSPRVVNDDLTPELASTAESHNEAKWHFAANSNQNLRSLSDDWDRFWMIDKPSALTPYPVMSTSGKP